MKQERIKTMRLLPAIALGAALAATAFAQSEINQRRENQQDRIANGVASGQLTPGETAKLETKEARLNREIRHERAENGGTLTAQDKAQINCRQNHLSRQIYARKHNGVRAPR
jgi:hypothetical protein